MSQVSRRLFGVLAVVALFSVVGCKSSSGGGESTPTGETKPLFDRLGGEGAVTAVIDDFVNRAAGDPKVNFTRKGTPAEWAATGENVTKLKKHLVQFVTLATGGPQSGELKYSGKDMKSVHAGMQISNAEFDAIAVDLAATLDKFKVPDKEKTELLVIVSSTRKDIVEKN